jgi:putative tryptophan/tyrosine transport system substrate-binding protein
MRRRTFIAGLGGAVAWPLVARGQQPALPVIGFLLPTGALEKQRENLAAFNRGLAETGYVEGRNVAIVYSLAEGHSERLPALAAGLVSRQVAVIVIPGSTPATLAAKAATQTIPIVFTIARDPVELGLVRSLNRPGGNLTGTVSLVIETRAKQVELLRKLVPTADLIAALVNPTNPNSEVETKELGVAARVLGVHMLILNASRQGDIEAAFATLVRERASGLVINLDAFFVANRDQVVALAARYAIPAIYASREFAEAGGLLAYGVNLQEELHQLGNYTGRILRGEKPADLPVYQATKFEFVINLKTAKALGLNLPPDLVAIADEVIE